LQISHGANEKMIALLKKTIFCIALLIVASASSATEANLVLKVGTSHPRLFLNTARLDELRGSITTTHAAIWQEIRTQADQRLKAAVPIYQENNSSNGTDRLSQLYQRDVGNIIPIFAIAWKLTGDRKYLNATKTWALASCNFPTWGLGKSDGMDLEAGHQLFALGIVYDWLQGDLDKEELTTIRNTIKRRGEAMYQSAVAGNVWWHRSYLQNHLWVNLCGLSIAGLAICDEYPAAMNWVVLALEKFRTTMDLLGPDGASHEGVGYWEYGVEYLLKFMFVARDLLAENLYTHEWWRNTAEYPLYLNLPQFAWTKNNCVVDLADSPRYHWYGPDYLLRHLAHEFHDGHAQWLAQQIDNANLDNPTSRWLNLIWFDPSVVSQSPSHLPTLKHFKDIGIVSARTDWSGDEALVIFKCGPPLGHYATDKLKFDAGSSHVHPDANNFVVFGNGEWIVRASGYAPKLTALENSLVIDGKGQTGEGAMWFDATSSLTTKAHPKILQADSSPTLDHIVGDATDAYQKSSGLTRFVRHLIFVKPNVLIIVDDIVSEKLSELDLFFHLEHEIEREKDGAFVGTFGTAAVRFDPLTPDGVTTSIESQTNTDSHANNIYKASAIRLRSKSMHWQNATAISWSTVVGTPPRVTLKQHGEGGIWHFAIGDSDVVFDWSDGSVKRLDRR